MPKITRDEIASSPTFQNAPDTFRESVSSRPLKALKSMSYRRIEDTRRLIVRECSQSDQPLSRAEICKALKRSKSPQMIALMEDLVADGILEKIQDIMPNGIAVYYYTIAFRVDARGNRIPDWLE